MTARNPAQAAGLPSGGHVHPSRGLHVPGDRSARRWDIQAMRGIAVLLVVLQHARFSVMAGGFLGVDIFFVISGFLMGGIIAEGIDGGRFTFAGFYARRVRRLLPAAYATIIVTALLAPFLLDGFEMHDFAQQAIGAFTFTVNFVLWKQINYFNNGAALKPLLHLWSLAVEEQYYLFLPVLLVVCPRRFRLGVTVVLAVSSLALCGYALRISPSAAFYFLPTRAWELGIGTAAALAIRQYRLRLPAVKPIRLLCWMLLLAVPLVSTEAGHPGLPAVIVCFATMLLLITSTGAVAPAWLTPLIAVGDRSYTLYLVHWPVYAFANNVFTNFPPVWVNAALLLVILVWMELQYRLVEQPLRRFVMTPRAIAALVLVPLLAGGATWALAHQAAKKDMEVRQGNHGFSAACTYKRDFEPRSACQNAADPAVLVWGDSFAMHLVGGVAATSPGGVIQATQEVCGPFLDIAPVDGIQHRRGWAENCMRFNRSVIDNLARRKDIRTVVLSSVLVQYIPGAEPELPWRVLRRTPKGDEETALDTTILTQSLATTVRAIRATGKKVVLVAPPPSLGFDIGRCLDRAANGLWSVSSRPGCDFSRAAYERQRAPTLEFLAQARRVVPVISFDDLLCGSGTCHTMLDGVPVYRDSAHLSVPGSVAVARRMKLGPLIEQVAR